MEINSPKSIYLIRHCKADGQAPDAILTSEGLKQARLLSNFLYPKQIDYIISSSYQRAIATIKPLAQQLGLQVDTDVRLCERVLSSKNYSDWQARLYETFNRQEMRLPGGETSREATDRGISVLNDLLSLPQKHIAVVTHGNLLCLMLRYFDAKYGFNEWKSMTNPDVFEIMIVNKKERVVIKRIWQ